MLHKTNAISLSYIRYKETSIIARLYTESFGLQAFVVNSVRSAKSRFSPALFQPLQLVELVQYHDSRKELHRLVEIKSAHTLHSIPFHHRKTAMGMFVAELLSAVVKEGQPNIFLFEKVWSWVCAFDANASDFENEHVRFLWEVLGPLGIAPEQWQDLFTQKHESHLLHSPELASLFEWFSGRSGYVKSSNQARQAALDALVRYLQTHLEGMAAIHSLDVLRAVFR